MQQRKWRRAVIVFVVIAVCAFMAGFPWWSGLRRPFSPPSESDAIVLLAGDYQGRAPAAARLYREGYAPKMILTNDGLLGDWSPDYQRNLYLIEWTEVELVRLGVPEGRIVRLPFYGSSTMYDALAVRRYALSHGMRKVIIVTSDYHVRRALWTFREAFSGLPTRFSAYPAASGAGPIGGALEYGKSLYYVIRYGILGLIPNIDERHVIRAGGNI